jgi:hypothetical protein
LILSAAPKGRVAAEINATAQSNLRPRRRVYSATRLLLLSLWGRCGNVGVAGGSEARDQKAHRDSEE